MIVEYAYFWKSMPAILFCLLSSSDCHGIEVLVGEDGSVEWEEPSEHVQWEATDTPTLPPYYLGFLLDHWFQSSKHPGKDRL